jgi:hypothetical protein
LVGSKSNHWCPYKEKKRAYKETDKHQEEHHVKRKAEVGMMQPEAKREQEGQPATTRS